MISGKQYVQRKSTGSFIHSYEHETKGLPIVQKFLDRINTDDALKEYISNMVELHMTPNVMANAKSKLKSTNRLFDKAVEPFDLIQLSLCDSIGKIPSQNDTEEFLMQRYKAYTDIMSQPHVTEHDLIKAGIEQSEQLVKVLDYSHKLRLAGCDKENSLRQSIAYAKKILKIQINP